MREPLSQTIDSAREPYSPLGGQGVEHRTNVTATNVRILQKCIPYIGLCQGLDPVAIVYCRRMICSSRRFRAKTEVSHADQILGPEQAVIGGRLHSQAFSGGEACMSPGNTL
jgi:hypothetical protein